MVSHPFESLGNISRALRMFLRTLIPESRAELPPDHYGLKGTAAAGCPLQAVEENNFSRQIKLTPTLKLEAEKRSRTDVGDGTGKFGGRQRCLAFNLCLSCLEENGFSSCVSTHPLKYVTLEEKKYVRMR